VVGALDHPATPDPTWSALDPDPATSSAPYRLYNIGNNQPVELLDLIAVIERTLGKEARKIMLPMQPGDVEATYADIDALERDMSFRPETPIEEGISRFVAWFRQFHRI
jgi:UDP-glucuronate 4-epimerase